MLGSNKPGRRSSFGEFKLYSNPASSFFFFETNAHSEPNTRIPHKYICTTNAQGMAGPGGVEPEVSELEGTVSLGIYVKGGKRIQETQQYYNNWGRSSLEQGFRRTSSMQNLVNAPGFQ